MRVHTPCRSGWPAEEWVKQRGPRCSGIMQHNIVTEHDRWSCCCCCPTISGGCCSCEAALLVLTFDGFGWFLCFKESFIKLEFFYKFYISIDILRTVVPDLQTLCHIEKVLYISNDVPKWRSGSSFQLKYNNSQICFKSWDLTAVLPDL